jgi:hypothetical protein
MPASILRWRGGAGGDMILYFKSLSDPGSVINVEFDRIDQTGKTNVDFSKVKQFGPQREIDKIALNPDWLKQIKTQQLSAEIADYVLGSKSVWIKSHYYDIDQFDDITVDLVADPMSLPFVVFSNIAKTDTVERNFNHLAESITDPVLKNNYSLYSVAVDNVMNFQPSGLTHLLVSDILSGLETFKTATDRVNLRLDFKFFEIYNHWLANNHPHLPSKQYQKMIQNCDYDFMNTTLSPAERYSLMALSGNKFINLC